METAEYYRDLWRESEELNEYLNDRIAKLTAERDQAIAAAKVWKASARSNMMHDIHDWVSVSEMMGKNKAHFVDATARLRKEVHRQQSARAVDAAEVQYYRDRLNTVSRQLVKAKQTINALKAGELEY